MDTKTLKTQLNQIVTNGGIVHLSSTFSGGVKRAMEYELKEPKVFKDSDGDFVVILLSPKQKLETPVLIAEAVKQLEPPKLEEVAL